MLRKVAIHLDYPGRTVFFNIGHFKMFGLQFPWLLGNCGTRSPCIFKMPMFGNTTLGCTLLNVHPYIRFFSLCTYGTFLKTLLIIVLIILHFSAGWNKAMDEFLSAFTIKQFEIRKPSLFFTNTPEIYHWFSSIICEIFSKYSIDANVGKY